MTTFMGFHMRRDGYGAIYSGIEKELARMNVPWRFIDMCENETWTRPQEREWHIDDTTIAMCIPDWLPDIYAPKKYAFTMFEATRMPANWIERLNQCAAMIVPCQWNADSFKANGVTVPIYLCPLGIDPQEYAPIERNGNHAHAGKPYTFLWSGTPDRRKGWDIAYRAFRQAFGDAANVKLVMHFRMLPKWLKGCEDSNVEIIEGKLFPNVINQMYSDADCYVYPARGEGWGLPPREAAATGLPVIVTNYGGLAEGIDYWGLPLNQVSTSPADYGFWDCDLGEWGEPNIDELAEKMRWVFENQKSAACFGQNAAQWLRRNQTWELTAKRLKEIVEP